MIGYSYMKFKKGISDMVCAYIQNKEKESIISYIFKKISSDGEVTRVTNNKIKFNRKYIVIYKKRNIFNALFLYKIKLRSKKYNMVYVIFNKSNDGLKTYIKEDLFKLRTSVFNVIFTVIE